jgi:hypothetical protein
MALSMGKLAKSFNPCHNAAAISVVSKRKITLALSLFDFSLIILLIFKEHSPIIKVIILDWHSRRVVIPLNMF